ncbi:MFS transporter [Pantoea ananatis]|uniref:MFS transporter n=1 Tax=Pantoea ananas TaxID=553 RepID=UPI001B3110BD|nr:MFS transporter [Pantoea ananatis]
MSDYTSDVKSSQPDLPPAVDDSQKILVSILGAVAFSHCCNDFIQAMLPSIYPLLKTNFTLSYAQIGLITLIYQMTASLLQPWIGLYTDKHPKPWLLPSGMVSTLIGIGLLAMAPHFSVVLVASALIGVGSATFHPEASRVARMASGGRFGTAQSTFQVGGYIGTAFAPLVAAMLIIPHGQIAVGWLMIIALFAVIILSGISRWTVKHGHAHMKKHNLQALRSLSSRDVKVALSVVGVLLLAKFTYIASISNYYIFYLVERFQLPIPQAQIYLFTFLASVAVGTLAGGPIGDRIGRKAVVWISFLGVIPFSLLMPHANLFWTVVLTVCIGLVFSSAFAALVVYAQEVLPGRTGMVAGIMFGTMFGIGGIAAAALGKLADGYGITTVYNACGFLPLLGFATLLMPDTRRVN